MLVAGAFMSASMMSCSKCGYCDTGAGSANTEYCQKDSKTAYDSYKAACEAAGYSWKTK